MKMFGTLRLKKHIDILFLLIQPSQSQSQTTFAKSITDKYYCMLYASLHDTRLASSLKQGLRFSLQSIPT